MPDETLFPDDMFGEPDILTETDDGEDDSELPEYLIKPNTIDRDMCRHAAEVAYWHTQHAASVTNAASIKIRITRMRSEKYLSLRQLAEAAGKKSTEKTIEAQLDGDMELRALMDDLLTADTNTRGASVATTALKVKGDMLTGLNLRRNAELRHAGMGT